MQNDIEKAILALKTASVLRTLSQIEAGEKAYYKTIHGVDIELILSVLQEKQNRKWIPVTERLPGKGERVLFCDNIFVAEGYLNINKAWHRYDGISVNLFDIKVTHWMSLPKPPEVTE